MVAVLLKGQPNLEQEQRDLKLKNHIKSQFPSVTRNAQRKLQTMKLQQLSNNRDLFLGSWNFQLNQRQRFERDLANQHTLGKERLKKLCVVAKDPKIDQRKRVGFVTDEDVRKLLELKEELFPLYNYKLLNEKLQGQIAEAHGESSIVRRQLQELLKQNINNQNEQEMIKLFKDVSSELNLPSMRQYIQ